MSDLDRTLVSKRAADKITMSSQQIKALKLADVVADSQEHATKRFWLKLWASVQSAFTPRFKKSRIDCRIDGHRLPFKGWKPGKMPQCADCGQAIEDPNSLRRIL